MVVLLIVLIVGLVVLGIIETVTVCELGSPISDKDTSDYLDRIENENLIKEALLDSFNGSVDKTQINTLMKVVIIEKMVLNILDELNQLKKSYVKNDILSDIEV